MQLDDLKQAWKQEIEMTTQTNNFDTIRRDVDKFEQKSKFWVAIELLSIIAVIAAVSVRWLTTEGLNVPSQIGMAAMIAAGIFVGCKIIITLRLTTVNDWTLAAKLNSLIEKREKEVKLLTSVAYWYLSPLFAAILLASYGGYTQRTGSYVPDAGLWGYWALAFSLYIGVYLYNQYALKTKVRPILNQLYNLKTQLDGKNSD